MPLLLLPPPTTTAAAAAFSRPPPPPPSRLRASRHLLFAFPRLRKYGRRDREPVATSFDEESEEDEDYDGEGEEEDDEEEVEVDEDEYLKNRPKPVGFGAGKTYTTDIEEQLLREMGLGGGRRTTPAKSKNRAAASISAKETGEDLNDGGVRVRVWNLPKKKNIHKDLNLAFKGFPGLKNIEPAVSANKKTRDPICKGFAYLKLESLEAASRFVELYSQKAVSFGKVQKPIKCCIVDAQSSIDSENQPSSSQAIRQPGFKAQNLVAAS
uniref:RRM domain-containing protein n=1 Tax=Leersia perrieri TaxID=77586 RepID=A0A0D9VFF2_9ORYZ